MAESNDLRTDEWIKSVLEGAPEGATVIVAYIGERLTTRRKVLRRLYTSASLDVYIEVLEEDIIWSQHLPEAHSPLGGSVVWLRRDAHVQHIQTTARQAQAGMLAGSDFAQQAASAQTVPNLSLRAAYVAGLVATAQCGTTSYGNIICGEPADNQ